MSLEASLKRHRNRLRLRTFLLSLAACLGSALLAAGAVLLLGAWFDWNVAPLAALLAGTFGAVLAAGLITVLRGPSLERTARLLEAGVDPDTQLNMHRPGRGGNTARFTDDLLTTGCTPLLRAAATMDRRAVELLLQHGAAPDLPNVMGVTPLMAASGIGYGQGSSRAGVPAMGPDPEANAVAIIQMLLQAGADVNAQITDTSSRTAVIARPSAMSDRQGQTALFGTLSRGWPRVARLLLDHGARVDVEDARGRTLHDALEGNAGGRDDPAGPELGNAELRSLIREALGL